jgi:hypothetical protein
MEVSEVRKRVLATVEHAKRRAAGQRAVIDKAERDYPAFLSRIAVPLFRQLAGILKAEGYHFTVFTPGGGVRLMSDKSADDFIELALDTSGDEPAVLGHVKRARGRRVIESERPVATGPVETITEDQLLDFLLKELAPFVER